MIKKIFVGKRIDNQTAWQMPQGGVDDNEDYETAARRELYEETGIQSIRIIKKSKESIHMTFLNTYWVKYGKENIWDKNKTGF